MEVLAKAADTIEAIDQNQTTGNPNQTTALQGEFNDKPTPNQITAQQARVGGKAKTQKEWNNSTKTY